MIENRAPQLEAVLALFLSVCVIAVALRCYCRIFLVKSFTSDDWFAVASLILFVLYTTFASNGIAHGTGRLSSLISAEDLPVGMMWWWLCEPAFVLMNMALKQSIAIFLLRIAVAKNQRLILYTAIIVTQLYSIYFLFLFIFQCWPVSHFWNQYRGDDTGHCLAPSITVTSFYIYSAVSCVTDWTFCIVPIFMVSNLQMDRRTKISVSCMLGLAAIASTATIVRIPYIRGLEDTANFLYATTDVAIWSTVETGLGIATCALSTLRPLLKKLKSSTRGGSYDRTTPSRLNRLGSYHMKNSRTHDGHVQMRDGNGSGNDNMDDKNIGISTVVATGGGGVGNGNVDDRYVNYDRKGRSGNGNGNGNNGGGGGAGSITALKDGDGWNDSAEHTHRTLDHRDSDSDDFVLSHSDFDQGIRKTVQVSQV